MAGQLPLSLGRNMGTTLEDTRYYNLKLLCRIEIDPMQSTLTLTYEPDTKMSCSYLINHAHSLDSIIF